MPPAGHPHRALEIRKGPDPSVRYESGLTIYEEALVRGHWIGRYWSAIGRVQPEAEAVPEIGPTREIDAVGPDSRAAFRLVIDDTDMAGGWTWVGAREVDEEEGQVGRRKGRHDVVELQHRSKPVRVRVHTQVDGSPFLVRWLDVTNLSSRSMALSKLASWSGLVWRIPNYPPLVPEELGRVFKVGYYASQMWCYEGDFAWEPVSPGETGSKDGWVAQVGDAQSPSSATRRKASSSPSSWPGTATGRSCSAAARICTFTPTGATGGCPKRDLGWRLVPLRSIQLFACSRRARRSKLPRST